MKKWLLLGLLVPSLALAVPATLTIDFTAPAVRQDGTPLTTAEIAEFVFYDSCSSTPVELVSVPSGSTVSTSVDWAAGSSHSICFVTIDTDNQAGSLSASYDFTFDVTSYPGTGTIDSITVTCSGTVCRVSVQ